MRNLPKRLAKPRGTIRHFLAASLLAVCSGSAAEAAGAEERGVEPGVGPAAHSEAAEPAPEELESVDAALETVRDVCSRTLSLLLAELRARCPGLEARQSGGRSKKNDYRNYQWISVKCGDREYLLCTHHNNLDTRTGNPHTQPGRIQFWKCEGPNGPHSRDGNGVWRYHFENGDAELPRISVWDEDFSVTDVADRFLAFLERNGEKLPRDSGRGGSGLRTAASVADRRRADEAIETVRAVEAKAMAAIVAELRRRHPDWFVRSSHGNSRANDYRCYQWITVRLPEETFWISMMHNDQDPYTGNTHTQFGRIQFWRGIVRGEYEDGSGRKSELGPHTRDEGGWRFRSDKQWRDMPRLHLWSPEYSTALVVDLFEQFLEEVGK